MGIIGIERKDSSVLCPWPWRDFPCFRLHAFPTNPPSHPGQNPHSMTRSAPCLCASLSCWQTPLILHLLKSCGVLWVYSVNPRWSSSGMEFLANISRGLMNWHWLRSGHAAMKTVPFLPEGNRRLIVPSFLIHQTQTLEGDVRRVSVSHLTLAFCAIFHLCLPSFCCLFSDKHQRSDKEQCSVS